MVGWIKLYPNNNQLTTCGEVIAELKELRNSFSFSKKPDIMNLGDRIQYQRLICVVGKHTSMEFEMKPYKLMGNILSVKGDCTAEHKVGEQFDLTLWDPERDATRTRPSLCPFFYNMILPYLAVLQFGETFPWKGDEDSFQISCPDPANQVTLEIKRIKV